MSIRSRVRNAIVAAGALLGGAGVVVVASLSSPSNNLDLDCVMPADGGPGIGHCDAILSPPRAQCPALMASGGDPPGSPDAGAPASTRVERALEAMRNNNVVDAWHCESAVVDGGSGCWCDMRGSVIVTPNGKIDGQAPGWRDAIDAAGAGSILSSGRLLSRPLYAKRSGCRAHVYAGEDPCAGSVGLDGGPDVDGGP